MRVWLFYHEDEGEKGENSFTVVANDHEQAFELAFESYGPQVNDMYYREVYESSEGLKMETKYLGYLIRPSTDPWAIKYNMPFEYFKIDGDGQIHGAATVQDCKDEIDERLNQWMENYDKQHKAKIV